MAGNESSRIKAALAAYLELGAHLATARASKVPKDIV